VENLFDCVRSDTWPILKLDDLSKPRGFLAIALAFQHVPRERGQAVGRQVRGPDDLADVVMGDPRGNAGLVVRTNRA